MLGVSYKEVIVYMIFQPHETKKNNEGHVMLKRFRIERLMNFLHFTIKNNSDTSDWKVKIEYYTNL